MAMWKPIIAGVLIFVSGTPQGPGEPTEAGRTALQELARHCTAAGGLKEVPAVERTGLPTWAISDLGRLKVTLEANRPALTSAVRDALIDRAKKAMPGTDMAATSAFLSTLGDVSGDRLASAFAIYFEAESLKTIGLVNEAITHFDRAAARFEECGDPVDRASCYHEMAKLHHSRGQLVAALEVNKKALHIRRELLGERHRKVADSYYNIGVDYIELCELTYSLDSLTKALTIYRSVLGERHPDVADNHIVLAEVYRKHGSLPQALNSLTKAIEIRRVSLGERHPKVADSYCSKGMVYRDKRDLVPALECFTKALEIRRSTLGERHPDVANSLKLLTPAELTGQ
jgi:tetratricopeptide (TPR) repeat protein